MEGKVFHWQHSVSIPQRSMLEQCRKKSNIRQIVEFPLSVGLFSCAHFNNIGVYQFFLVFDKSFLVAARLHRSNFQHFIVSVFMMTTATPIFYVLELRPECSNQLSCMFEAVKNRIQPSKQNFWVQSVLSKVRTLSLPFSTELSSGMYLYNSSSVLGFCQERLPFPCNINILSSCLSLGSMFFPLMFS